jgi:hypothetical protein
VAQTLEKTMTTTPEKIHVGRLVRFSAGYGGTDGAGAIVAVRGTVNMQPAQRIGIMRVIRADDCEVDVILFDGRMLRGIEQCGIDAPGIGIKLLDDVLDDVSHLPALVAERDAAEAIAAAKARAEFEAAEAARVIADPPLFYWNGIKDHKGAKLQKVFYSLGNLRNHPDATITIYGRGYEGFSAKVRECFAVQNDTDTQVDYFDNDRIRVIPSHPLYAAVKAAHDAGAARNAKRYGRAEA